MSVEFFFRIFGMFIFAGVGGYWGLVLSSMSNESAELYAIVFGLLGSLIGLILTPYFTTRPARYVKDIFGKVSVETLFASLAGLAVGLILATLLSSPLSMLPDPFGRFLPIGVAIFFSYLGIATFVIRQRDIFMFIRSIAPSFVRSATDGYSGERLILLDTSVIIDGRIADIARTGFLPGTLLIPRFILTELQHIADSTDGLRRQRGRRGLDVLAELQKDPTVSVRITDMNVEGAHAVDDKLIILARQIRCPVLTNDYNLNKVADLQGVVILNINELTNAVKAVVLPGEALTVKIIQEGKEHGQGVGYLEDGTMIVVESGNEYLSETIPTIVTKVLQTAAGRMIFSRPIDENNQFENNE